jgi:hypothetical protein
MDRVPPKKDEGATILLIRKGWQEDETEVSILANCILLHIKEWRCSTHVEAVRN